jgi:hypothetical protein
MSSLTERYAAQIRGTLSCFDRVVLMGTIPGICFARGMEAYLRARGIRLVDYPRFAQPLRDEVHQTIRQLAQEAGIEIEVIHSPNAFRKEARAIAGRRRRWRTRSYLWSVGSLSIMSAMGKRNSRPAASTPFDPRWWPGPCTVTSEISDSSAAADCTRVPTTYARCSACVSSAAERRPRCAAAKRGICFPSTIPPETILFPPAPPFDMRGRGSNRRLLVLDDRRFVKPDWKILLT